VLLRKILASFLTQERGRERENLLLRSEELKNVCIFFSYEIEKLLFSSKKEKNTKIAHWRSALQMLENQKIYLQEIEIKSPFSEKYLNNKQDVLNEISNSVTAAQKNDQFLLERQKEKKDFLFKLERIQKRCSDLFQESSKSISLNPNAKSEFLKFQENIRSLLHIINRKIYFFNKIPINLGEKKWKKQEEHIMNVLKKWEREIWGRIY